MFTDKQNFYIGLIIIGAAALLIIYTIALILKPKNSKWLFGTTNIRWGVKELIKTASGKEEAYWSTKRIQSIVSFSIMQWGMIHWLVLNIDDMGYIGISAWAAVEGAMCGYVINRIEAAKPKQTTTASATDAAAGTKIEAITSQTG
jgi:hypothetical protein